jgi:hypothetical protein
LRSETTSEFRIGRTKQNNIETSFEDMKKFRKREGEGRVVCVSALIARWGLPAVTVVLRV